MRAPETAPHIAALRPYVAGKPIEEVQREYGLSDIIKLASNESPRGPSPQAIAAIEAAAPGLQLYPDGAAYDLIGALSRHWGVERDQLIVGNGSDEIIQLLGIAFLEPGDEVLTAEPSFVRYEAAAQLNQAEYVGVPLRDFTYDLEAMAERLSPRTRIIFIANPNNPTGTMVGGAELNRFLDQVPERALVALDEAYFEYVEEADYPRSLDYLGEGRNVIVLRTFSKIYALAGLRVGYGIARPEIIQALHQVREPFNVNALAQAAAVASLGDPGHVERARQSNRSGLRYYCEQFQRLGLDYVPSCANFVLLDVGRDCREVYEGLLRQGVIVRTGDIFGLPTHLRVTVGTPSQNERFIGALQAVLQAEPAPA